MKLTSLLSSIAMALAVTVSAAHATDTPYSGTSAHQVANLADAALVKSLPGSKDGYADVNGVRLHDVVGDKGEQPALFSGWPETWWTFHKIMPALAENYIADNKGYAELEMPIRVLAGPAFKWMQVVVGKTAINLTALPIEKSPKEQPESITETLIDCLLIIGATALQAVASALAPQGAQAEQTGIDRQQLPQHDLSMPGSVEYQQRLDVDPGKVVPNHRHHGEEVIYVIEGTMEYRLEGQPPVTLKAGDVLFVPADVTHSAKNVGTTKAAELGTFLVPKGKPLRDASGATP